MRSEKILEILFNNERIEEADDYMDKHPQAGLDEVLSVIYPALKTEFISNECSKRNKDFLNETFRGFNPLPITLNKD